MTQKIFNLAIKDGEIDVIIFCNLFKQNKILLKENPNQYIVVTYGLVPAFFGMCNLYLKTVNVATSIANEMIPLLMNRLLMYKVSYYYCLSRGYIQHQSLPKELPIPQMTIYSTETGMKCVMTKGV